MKLSVLLTVALFTLIGSNNCANAQVPDSVVENRLYFVVKAWGHYKYHHRNIMNGMVDWDEALINCYEGIKSAPNNAAFNDSLKKMLDMAGPIIVINGPVIPAVPDSLDLNHDTSWMQDDIFSSENYDSIFKVFEVFKPSSNVYVQEQWPGGPPTFESDDKYSSELVNCPEEKLRFLALARYWNIIHYYFPYKELADIPWDQTLEDFIPQVIEANTDYDYQLAMRQLTARIDDSHAFFLSDFYSEFIYGLYPAPFLIKQIDGKTILTRVHFAFVDELSPGDELVEIDGFPIALIRDSLRAWSFGSHQVGFEENLNRIILGGSDDLTSCKVFDGADTSEVVFSRSQSYGTDLYSNPNPIFYDTVLPGGCHVGIVDFDKLEVEHLDNMFDSLKNTDALIFDIRNYPNGVNHEILDYLFPNQIHYCNFTSLQVRHPGRMEYVPLFSGNGSNDPYTGRLIILMNEESQSHAEYTIMPLEQHPYALKIGSPTAGADGNVGRIYLPGRILTYASFLGVWYFDNRQTQRIGLQPDIEVLPSIQGVREGRDELLEFALSCSIAGTPELEQITFGMSPNPATDEVNIVLPNGSNQAKLKVVNMLGKIVLQKELSANTNQVNVSELPPATYLVRLETSLGIVNKYLMIE